MAKNNGPETSGQQSNDPLVAKLEKDIQKLQTENITLSTNLGAAQKESKDLSVKLEAAEKENTELKETAKKDEKTIAEQEKKLGQALEVNEELIKQIEILEVKAVGNELPVVTIGGQQYQLVTEFTDGESGKIVTADFLKANKAIAERLVETGSGNLKLIEKQ